MRVLLTVAFAALVLALECYAMAGVMLLTHTRETSVLWAIPMGLVALGIGTLASGVIE